MLAVLLVFGDSGSAVSDGECAFGSSDQTAQVTRLAIANAFQQTLLSVQGSSRSTLVGQLWSSRHPLIANRRTDTHTDLFLHEAPPGPGTLSAVERAVNDVEMREFGEAAGFMRLKQSSPARLRWLEEAERQVPPLALPTPHP